MQDSEAIVTSVEKLQHRHGGNYRSWNPFWKISSDDDVIEFKGMDDAIGNILEDPRLDFEAG